MQRNQIRKTHPMVLIAATALTIFSILGSAAITGLIPSAHSERNEQNISQKKLNQNSIKLMNPADSETARTVTGKISEHNQKALGHSVAANPICTNCGKIVSIKKITTDGDASGLGAVAGGVTGGVIGNQIGKGKGNILMTVIGAGGGAYAGHTIEKKINAETKYVIKIKMETGEYRTITQQQPPEHAIGDEVKLAKGRLVSA